MLEFWFECLSMGAKGDFGELNDGLIERAKGIEREPEESQGKRMAARETKGTPGPTFPSPPAPPTSTTASAPPPEKAPHYPASEGGDGVRRRNFDWAPLFGFCSLGPRDLLVDRLLLWLGLCFSASP